MRVEVEHLVRTYGGKRAVDDLSFSLSSGQVIGFIGPNGAGKTTTMSIMATLDSPTSGDVRIDGRSILDYPLEARAQIGFMPDELPSHGDITVHEYLDFFGRAAGMRGAKLAAALAEVEEFAGLCDLRGKVLSALSKGMKQRVSLARAIVHDPGLLILDEPANGLDPRARVELRELVRVLAERGKAILVSSHILTELSEMCTGALIIERGRLVASRDLGEAAERQALLKVRVRAIGAEPASLARALLETPGVRDARLAPDGAEADLEGGDEEAATLLSSLLARGFRVCGFHAQRQNLEDVFLSVTKGDVA